MAMLFEENRKRIEELKRQLEQARREGRGRDAERIQEQISILEEEFQKSPRDEDRDDDLD